jgi:hypothetical protein
MVGRQHEDVNGGARMDLEQFGDASVRTGTMRFEVEKALSVRVACIGRCMFDRPASAGT